MERRQQIIEEHEAELESVKQQRLEAELAVEEQERKMKEVKKKGKRMKALEIYPFVTHTRPYSVTVAYPITTVQRGLVGNSTVVGDCSAAISAQQLTVNGLPALNNKNITELGAGGGSEEV